MAIKSAPYYWLICDRCGESSTETDDVSAWADEASAMDKAMGIDWTITNAAHLCPGCRRDTFNQIVERLAEALDTEVCLVTDPDPGTVVILIEHPDLPATEPGLAKLWWDPDVAADRSAWATPGWTWNGEQPLTDASAQPLGHDAAPEAVVAAVLRLAEAPF
jgi:hypothetical protein